MLDAAVVSDVHCDGPGSATQVAFLRFLAGLRARRLVLAGDIFHTFWSPGGAAFAAYQPVVDALGDFDLVVLPGNHDWSVVRTFPDALGFGSDAVGARVRVVLGGLEADISHGDEADDSVRYRSFHRLLRGRAFAALLDTLGDRGAWALLHRLAGRLGDGTPSARLVARQHLLAAGRIAEGAHLVVMGHTHAPECRQLGGGIFLNPGDWVRHRTWGAVVGGKVELRRFDEAAAPHFPAAS
jgi:UDP-2,3-diacylglucosamine pyrophosphatase LpxH